MGSLTEAIELINCVSKDLDKVKEMLTHITADQDAMNVRSKMNRKPIKFICYFDGACDPNPEGRMGVGSAIFRNNIKSKPIEYTCNYNAHPDASCNTAEYLAFRSVLEYLIKNAIPNDTIEIYGDSKLVANQMHGKWKIKDGHYYNEGKRCMKLLENLKEITRHINIQWIPRDMNQLADDLSKSDKKPINYYFKK